jgi:hypothetical protein
MKKIFSIFAIVLIAMTACSSTGQSSTRQATATPSSQPTATEGKVFPTPSSPGNSIFWDDLRVTMEQIEITQDYVTEYGSTRSPSPGQKFLWVNIGLKNTGQIERDIPLSENFSVLYAGTELKPGYGHRHEYADYTALGSVIFPNQELKSWLRFDIPTAAALKDLRFVFLPESSQVGASYSSPNYPYGDDKPTYVWKCEP